VPFDRLHIISQWYPFAVINPCPKFEDSSFSDGATQNLQRGVTWDHSVCHNVTTHMAWYSTSYSLVICPYLIQFPRYGKSLAENQFFLPNVYLLPPLRLTLFKSNQDILRQKIRNTGPHCGVGFIFIHLPSRYKERSL